MNGEGARLHVACMSWGGAWCKGAGLDGGGKRTPSPWQRIEAPPAGNGRSRDSSRQRLGETLGGHAPPKRLRPPALSSVTVLNGAPGWRGGRVDVVQHNT